MYGMIKFSIFFPAAMSTYEQFKMECDFQTLITIMKMTSRQILDQKKGNRLKYQLLRENHSRKALCLI